MNTNTPSQSKPKPELFVQKNIHRRWLKIARDAEKVLAFSPYVTDPFASKLLTSSTTHKTELHTDFTATNFASGASSIQALAKLLANKVELYHLPELHAKILLIPGKCVTIGSQNITQAGRSKREASALFTDTREVNLVEEAVKSWMKDRVRVTQTMIEEMTESIKDFKKRYRDLIEDAKQLDERLLDNQRVRDQKERERQEAERKRLEEEKREADQKQREEAVRQEKLRASRSKSTSEAVSRLRFASHSVVVTVQKTGNSLYSLLASSNQSLTSWWVGGWAVLDTREMQPLPSFRQRHR